MLKLQKSRYNRSEKTFLSFPKNTVAPVDRFNLFWRRQVSFQYNPVGCVTNALFNVLEKDDVALFAFADFGRQQTSCWRGRLRRKKGMSEKT